MRPVIIIAIAFVLLIPTTVFAQEESLADIAKRLDAENLEKAKQTGSITQPSPDIPQQPLQKIDCPKGTYQGLDNQNKNPACRDINTNQIVDPNTGLMYDSQTGDIILDDEQMIYVGIGIFVVIVIVAIIAKASQSNSKSYKDTPRRNFSSDVEENVLKNQGYKCNDCQTPIGVVKGRMVFYDFDHIDGNNHNNSPDNCQALCKNCHAKKTERERNMDRNSI